MLKMMLEYMIPDMPHKVSKAIRRERICMEQALNHGEVQDVTPKERMAIEWFGPAAAASHHTPQR